MSLLANDYEVKLLTPAEASIHWYEILPLIKRGIARDAKITIDEIKMQLFLSQSFCWVVVKDNKIITAAICQILESAIGQYCLIYSIAGTNMRQWLHYLNDIEQWAKDKHCRYIECFCRRGWVRLLKPKCFKVLHYVLHKELE